MLELDHKIFEDYWKNSKSSLEETMKSCNNNYLFKSGGENNLDGYEILGGIVILGWVVSAIYHFFFTFLPFLLNLVV